MLPTQAPKSVFDTQVGFNMLSSYGSESRANLAAIRAAIVDEVRIYLAGRMAMPAIALVHAPVFYSHTFMAYAEFEVVPSLEELVTRLKQAGLTVLAGNDESPTNVNVAGEARPVLRKPERDPSHRTRVLAVGRGGQPTGARRKRKRDSPEKLLAS